MDLAKIVSDLRLELNCLNAAIAAMEQLSRVQKAANFTPEEGSSQSEQPQMQSDLPPAKRGRGRPRKNPLPLDAVLGASKPVSMEASDSADTKVPAA